MTLFSLRIIMLIVLLQEDVMSGLDFHGKQYANGRLWPRLDGKVTLEQFIAALRRIGNGELADKIEGIILLQSL